MAPTEIAYIAGLFDGEGNIHLQASRRDAPSRHLRLVIDTTDQAIAEWLHIKTGLGKVCEFPPKPPRKAHWRWQLFGRQAAELLCQLMPYLRIKRAQAQIALEYHDRPKVIGRPVTAAEAVYHKNLIDRLQQLIAYGSGRSVKESL